MAYIQGMAKKQVIQVVKGQLDPGKPGKPKYRSVELDGKRLRLRVVDADSPRFAADFQASFTANVRRARNENRALKRG